MKLENQKLVKENLREEIVLDDVGEMSGVGRTVGTHNNATERNKTHLSRGANEQSDLFALISSRKD